MSWIYRLSLKHKILIAISFPLLAYLPFLYMSVHQFNSLTEALTDGKYWVDEQLELDQCRHAIFIERGLSLLSGELYDKTVITKARTATDQALKNLLSKDIRIADNIAQCQLNLGLIRHQIDNQQLSFQQTILRFEQIISLLKFKSENNPLTRLPTDSSLFMRSALLLSQYQNKLGLNRAYVTKRASQPSLTSTELQSWSNLRAELSLLKNIIHAEFPAKLRQRLKHLTASTAWQKAHKLTQKINHLKKGATLTEKPEEVFKIVSAPVDTIAMLGASTKTLLKTQLSDTLKQEKQREILHLSFLCFLMLLVAYILISVLKPFNQDIEKLVRATLEVKKENFDVAIQGMTGQEMGILQDHFNAMVATLKRVTTANEQNAWIKDNIASIATRLFTVDNIDEATKVTLSFLADQIDIAIGAVYMRKPQTKGQSWHLLASYAMNVEPNSTPSFSHGQAVLGQCAIEKKMKLLQDIPQDCFSIKTALAEFAPTQTCLVPLIDRQEVIGVMEVASAKPLTEVQLDLLQVVCDNLAMVINSLERQQQIASLLEETQQLSEETQLQSEELARSNDLLREKNQTIQVSNTELKKVADDLKIISAYKSDFLTNMSHELRTPLNSLMLLSELLINDEDNPLTPDQLDSLTIIHKNGSDLLRLVDDILDLSKVEAGKLDLQYEDTDTMDLIESLKKIFYLTAQSKGLQFIVKCDPSMPPIIHTDPFRLEQILKNLLSNACKFTDEGRVELHSFAPTADQLSALQLPNRTNEWIGFHVTDTGEGIDSQLIDRLFEPFDQLEQGIDRRYGGTGLGLAICKGLVELLGGKIECRSEKGKGTCITVFIPIKQHIIRDVEPLVDEDFTTIKTSLDQHTRPTLLLVTKDPSFAKKIQELAANIQIKISESSDATEAIEIARSHRLQGAIIDLGSNDKSLIQLAHHLKRDSDLSEIPIQLVADQSKFIGTKNAIGTLKKPISADKFSQAFNQLSSSTDLPTLVVEDDPDTVTAIRKILTPQRQITHVNTLEAAKQIVTHQEFSAIVLDLHLPDGDGLSLLKDWNSSFAVPPCIIFSAQDLDRQRYLDIRRYVDHIILKKEYAPRLFQSAFVQIDSSQTQQRTEPLEELTPLSFKGITLLIADDDLKTSFALAKKFSRLGMEVVIADSGQDALKKLEESKHVDVVLIDLMMPDGDGFELIQQIRSHEVYHSLPILVMTAGILTEHKQRALEYGANFYIIKPIEMDSVTKMISRLLQPSS